MTLDTREDIEMMTETSFLNLEQVAKILGVSERTVLRLLEKKEIKGFKVGRAWRFEHSDVEAYVEQQRRKAQGA
jgi:excisionase family DNA binding protein